MKVMTIIGTRPEIIRLSEVIKCCDKYFSHVLVHTGQNWDYSLNKIFFDQMGIRAPDIELDCAGNDLGETMGNIVARSFNIMEREKPDALLILGDTNSTLSAISAKRLKIPIFHMEAGNRCWDWNVSEMINRTIVDHIADINLAYTENSRRYLIEEGIDGKTIFVTGSPLREVLEKHRNSIEASNILERLCVKKGQYILVSAHREENIDDEKNFFELMTSLNTLADDYNMPVIYSMHPRSLKYITQRDIEFHKQIIVHEPFGFFDYVWLQLSSYWIAVRSRKKRPYSGFPPLCCALQPSGLKRWIRALW